MTNKAKENNMSLDKINIKFRKNIVYSNLQASECFEHAFNITRDRLHTIINSSPFDDHVVIICRPSQWGRLTCLLVDIGLCDLSAFNAKIFTPEDCSVTLTQKRPQVKFSIKFQHLSSVPVRRAFSEAFNITSDKVSQLRSRTHFTIEAIDCFCTSEQFGNFLILRNKYGGDNWFKELNSMLLSHQEAPNNDVSRNRNII